SPSRRSTYRGSSWPDGVHRPALVTRRTVPSGGRGLFWRHGQSRLGSAHGDRRRPPRLARARPPAPRLARPTRPIARRRPAAVGGGGQTTPRAYPARRGARGAVGRGDGGPQARARPLAQGRVAVRRAG